ncbi:hypothetical protein TNCV_197301 [Trichonephila clavipes]|nr:hypothetical protein TNCV_197301 [Trichonephila clavipes]
MAPHTITQAGGAVCCCKAKADNLVPFRCSPIPSCATPLQAKASLVGVISSTRNGRIPSAMLYVMVWEDIGALIEGSACVWTASNKADGSTRACLLT